MVFSVLKIVVKLTMKPEQLGAKMLEQLREKKNPDSIIGKRMGELWAHHRAYKKEFTKEDTMGTLVRLMARPLAKAQGWPLTTTLVTSEAACASVRIAPI